MPTGPPHLLVDAFALGDASQSRGIGTYLSTVLAGVARSPGFRTTVLAHEGTQLPEGTARTAMRRRLPPRWARYEHDLLLARTVARSTADVFWSPAQSPPRRAPMPWVQTLQDLTPLYFRHPLLEADRRWWSHQGLRLREAAAVVVPSQSTRRQAVELLGLDPARLHVIPLGRAEHFRPEGPVVRRDVPYVLMVAAWGPHKGFDEAMAAIALLADAGLPHRLVIAGRQDTWMQRHVDDLVRASPRPDRVECLGWVEDLPALYRGAAAVVVPSRAEGFGLPVVEGMACGACTVAYDNTSLREVVGDGGLLVPDGDVGALADALRSVLEDLDEAARVSARGLEHARGYSWDATVAGHLDVFAAVAAGSPARHSPTSDQ